MNHHCRTTSLLGAGIGLAHQTVRCSALNAEELRREGGLEALLEAISRCIPMIGLSSKPDDVPVQVHLPYYYYYYHYYLHTTIQSPYATNILPVLNILHILSYTLDKMLMT